MKSIVISLGGSVLFADDITSSYMQNLSSLLEEIRHDYKIYVIIGGGSPARLYIQRGRSFGLSETELDDLGILITRVNATLLSKLISCSNTIIPTSPTDAIKMKDDIVIMGGTYPGHSTDFVGAELAITAKADQYIIATNVDGIYDKDPNKFSDAKQIPEISITSLLAKYGSNWDAAGSNVVVDGPALKKISEGNIQTVVVNGKKITEIKNAIYKKPFQGTIIKIEKRRNEKL